MRSRVVLVIGLVWILVFSPAVFGFEGSFIFQPVSSSFGWWPYVCVAEKGVYGESFSTNYCDARKCPFEAAAFFMAPDWSGDRQDLTCNGEATILATCGELVSITIPSVEDVTLVNSDGFIVRDAVCKGDKIKIKESLVKGEYWDKGGTEDSPPIYWVDDFDKFFDDVMKYHEDTITDPDKITSEGLPSDRKDELFGVPFHKTPTGWARTYGGLVCGMDSGPVAFSGTDSEGEYHVVTGTDTTTLSYDTSIKCTFFYEYRRTFTGNYGAIVRVPSIVGYQIHQGDSEGVGRQCEYQGTSSVNRKEYYSKDDLFSVGAIEVRKSLDILPSNPDPVIQVKSFVSNDVLYEDEETIVRILIENKGKTRFEVKELNADVEYEFLGCDCDVLEEGEVGECLINIKPSMTVFVNIGLDYEYSRCGTDIHSHVSSQMKEVKIKVNSCSESEDCVKGYVCCMKSCRNPAKGICDDVDGDGWFEWSYY